MTPYFCKYGVQHLQTYINQQPGVAVFNWFVMVFFVLVRYWIPCFYHDVLQHSDHPNNCWDILFAIYKCLFYDAKWFDTPFTSSWKPSCSLTAINNVYTKEDLCGQNFFQKCLLTTDMVQLHLDGTPLANEKHYQSTMPLIVICLAHWSWLYGQWSLCKT